MVGAKLELRSLRIDIAVSCIYANCIIRIMRKSAPILDNLFPGMREDVADTLLVRSSSSHGPIASPVEKLAISPDAP
jgi:hypothetical protein